jgi:hypothetical protein
MKTDTHRPHRRPKLHLPLFLEAARRAEAETRHPHFPMATEQLRRTVAEMID